MNISVKLKQYFCTHDYRITQEITHLGPYYYQCQKCGKKVVCDRLCYGNKWIDQKQNFCLKQNERGENEEIH